MAIPIKTREEWIDHYYERLAHYASLLGSGVTHTGTVTKVSVKTMIEAYARLIDKEESSA